MDCTRGWWEAEWREGGGRNYSKNNCTSGIQCFCRIGRQTCKAAAPCAVTRPLCALYLKQCFHFSCGGNQTSVIVALPDSCSDVSRASHISHNSNPGAQGWSKLRLSFCTSNSALLCRYPPAASRLFKTNVLKHIYRNINQRDIL